MKPVAFDVYEETRRERDAVVRERDWLKHRADELDAKLANTRRQLKLAQRRLRAVDPSAKDHMDAMQRQAQQQSFAGSINGRW